MRVLISKIEQTAQETNFSGVISIFREGRAIYNAAFGYRDIKNAIANNTQTRFGIASGTKLFTALGIGTLIEQGRLSIQTKVSDLDLDLGIDHEGFDYERLNYREFIDPNATILTLLNHTSGIYDYYDEEIIDDFDNFFVEIPWYNLTTPTNYLPLFANKKMKFLSGQRFSYSNGGYVFLGIIIEKITGQKYSDYIQANVLEPAGMKNSGFFSLNDLPPNTANGYLSDQKTTNIYNIPISGGADGGMYSTTEDLNLFWHSLFSHKIIKQALLSEFTTTYHTFDQHLGYGCGLYKSLEDPKYAIVGGDAGVGAYSEYWVSNTTTINILSNITDGEEELKDLILENLADMLQI